MVVAGKALRRTHVVVDASSRLTVEGRGDMSRVLRCPKSVAEDLMQNPALFHVLMDYLEATGAAPMDIERFVDRWHRLRSHDAFPCPVCFLAGEEQPLAALPAQGKFEAVKCPTCRTQFDLPIDE